MIFSFEVYIKYLVFVLCFLFISDENLKAQLPWQSGSAACVTVYIYGACDFIMPADDCPIFMHSADDGSVSLPSWSGSLVQFYCI